LRIKNFIVPKTAPVFCAFGMLYADLRHNFTRPYYSDAGETNLDAVNSLFAEMELEAVDTFQKEGIEKEDIIIETTMDIRYKGQRRELTTTVPSKGLITEETLRRTLDLFHDRHSKIIGYSDPSFPAEIVRLHLAGIARISPPQPIEIAQGGHDTSSALKGKRKAYFREFENFTDTNIFDGDRLLAGNFLEGPCIVEERMTTLVVPPAIKVKVDRYGNYTTIMEGS